MDIKGLYEKLRDAQFNMNKAISNTMNHGPHYEQMKNILLNNLDGIVEALKYAVDAEQKIQILEIELNDAEAEIDELTANKTTAKNKKKATAENNG